MKVFKYDGLEGHPIELQPQTVGISNLQWQKLVVGHLFRSIDETKSEHGRLVRPNAAGRRLILHDKGHLFPRHSVVFVWASGSPTHRDEDGGAVDGVQKDLDGKAVPVILVAERQAPGNGLLLFLGDRSVLLYSIHLAILD